MKISQALLVGIGVVACLGVLSGCMAQRVNLVKAGVVSIHTEAEDSMLFSPAVYQDHGRLIVYGTARPRRPTFYMCGYVDIAVIGPDGTVLAAQHVSYRGDSPGKQPYTTFRAIFPAVPPAGSVIRVRHGFPVAAEK